MNSRIHLLVLLSTTLSTFFVPLAFGQEAIVIQSRDLSPYRKAIVGFKSGFGGSVDEYLLDPEGKNERELRLRLKRQQVSFIFILGSRALQFVKKEMNTIPTVFSFILNPETLLKDRGDKYRHIRGIGLNVPPREIFLVLQKIKPGIKTIGVVYDPTLTKDLIDGAEKAAHQLGITLVSTQIFKKNKAISAIKEMEGKVDALWMVPDTTVITGESIKYFLLFSFRNKIPLIGISDKYVRKGALFSLSFDSEDIGRQAGEIAKTLAQGKNIARYSEITPPRHFKLSINLQTAERIEVTIPQRIINGTHKVYP